MLRAHALFDMNEIVVHPDESRPLRLLKQLETPDNIHVKLVAATGADVVIGDHTQRRLVFELPRFRLSFELSGGRLRSQQHRGYHVRCADDTLSNVQALPLAAPLGLSRMLVLQPDSAAAPLRLLVPCPDTLPTWEVAAPGRPPCLNVGLPNEVEAVVRYHVYDVHPRTLMLQPRTNEARLYLAALYWRSDCRVPLPGIGRTGAEAALELLRQASRAEPMLPEEQALCAPMLQERGSLAAVPLLAQGTIDSGGSVAFLWHRDAEEEGSLREASLSGSIYAQDLRKTPAPFVHARRVLTPAEAVQHLGSAQLPGALRSHASNGEPSAPDATSGLLVTADSGASDNALLEPPHASALAGAARRVGVEFCESNQQHVQPSRAEAHFDGGDVSSTVLGRELMKDLRKSTRLYLEARRAELQDAPDGAAGWAWAEQSLQSLLDQTVDAQRSLRARLLAALRSHGGAAAGVTSKLLHAAGLVATPAQSDLVVLKTDTTLAQVRVGLVCWLVAIGAVTQQGRCEAADIRCVPASGDAPLDVTKRHARAEAQPTADGARGRPHRGRRARVAAPLRARGQAAALPALRPRCSPRRVGRSP